MISTSLTHTLPFDDTDTNDVCPFIANCVPEIETVFHGLIFWLFLFLPPIVANKDTRQI